MDPKATKPTTDDAAIEKTEPLLTSEQSESSAPRPDTSCPTDDCTGPNEPDDRS